MTIKVIVTDIEGTTSAIDFVHDVLFPYARKHLPDFVRKHQSEPTVTPILDSVRNETGESDADSERVIEILLQWIDDFDRHGLYAWGKDIASARQHAEGFEFLFECAWQEVLAKT